jgi:hypothetical protein
MQELADSLLAEAEGEIVDQGGASFTLADAGAAAEGNDAAISKFVAAVLSDAVRKKASDSH